MDDVPLQFKKATKQQAKARIAIAGPAGAGKTYTALAVATALGQRVALIDTEHGSASKYAGEPFQFDVLELTEFHPRRYIEAIRAAEQAGYEALVIDSGSHEWNGTGGCLELVDAAAKRLKGNSYVAWGEVTPLHNEFIEALHKARLHLIATFRSKMDYIQTENNGKKEIKKVGMAPITREGAEYEFDIVLEMDLNHDAIITKTRCSALADRVFHRPGADLATQVKVWLTDGELPVDLNAALSPADTPASDDEREPGDDSDEELTSEHPSEDGAAEETDEDRLRGDCEALRNAIRAAGRKARVKMTQLEERLEEIGDNPAALQEARRTMLRVAEQKERERQGVV